MRFPRHKKTEVAVVTARQMREVDALMIGKYHILVTQMMENAGRSLAVLIRRYLGGRVSGSRVAVAAGKGNNGGGGMVAARHLANWGADVSVLATAYPATQASKGQWEILKALPVRRFVGREALESWPHASIDLAVDALIGYSLAGDPHGLTAELIELISAQGAPVVALDVPSGLEATTGKIGQPCVRADVTITLALPKTGLLKEESRKVAGQIYLADISVPPILYNELGIDVGPLFAEASIVRLE